jgi:hypothetical protein
VIALGLLNLSWSSGRAYITLPPNNIFVQTLAGKKKSVLITLVFDTSRCTDEEAMRFNGVTTQFTGTITVIKRHDGAYWYRVSLPLRISRMLHPLKGCIKAQVFVEPWVKVAIH